MAPSGVVHRHASGAGEACRHGEGKRERDEVLLPYGTKFYIKKVHPKGHSFTDKAGTWGGTNMWVVEVIALPDPEDLK